MHCAITSLAAVALVASGCEWKSAPSKSSGDGRKLNIVSIPVGVKDRSILPGDAEEVQRMVKTIMENVSAGEYGDAFDTIRSVCSLPASDIDNLERHAVAQLTALRGSIGDCAGYDVADIATQGSALIRVTCIAKHTNIPLRWTFVFYKPEDKWILVKFKYDDKAVDGEFQTIR